MNALRQLLLLSWAVHGFANYETEVLERRLITFNILDSTTSTSFPISEATPLSSAPTISPQLPEEEEEDTPDETLLQVYKYAMVPSAFLSAVSSVLVVYHIFASRRKTPPSSRRRHKAGAEQASRTFNRFLIGLCLYDIVSSSTLALEPFLTNTDHLGHWSCTTSGFLKFCSVSAASAYNGGMSLFAFLVVCRNWRGGALSNYLEPFVHFQPLWITTFSFAGIFLEVYNPAYTSGCFASTYPPGCMLEDSLEECQRGDPWAPVWEVVIQGGYSTFLVVIFVCHISIFCVVRRQELRLRKFRFSSRAVTGRDLRQSVKPFSSVFRFSTTARNGNERQSVTIFSSREGRNSTNQQSPPMGSPAPIEGGATNAQKQSLAFRSSTLDESSSRSNTPHKKDSKIRQVAGQSILYCAGFLGAYIVTLVHTLATGGVQHYNAPWYPPVRIVQEIMYPLQGFFNFLVYIRPKYLQWKTALQNDTSGDITRWKALKMTLLAEDLSTYRKSKRSTANSSTAAGGGPQGHACMDQTEKTDPTCRNSVTFSLEHVNNNRLDISKDDGNKNSVLFHEEDPEALLVDDECSFCVEDEDEVKQKKNKGHEVEEMEEERYELEEVHSVEENEVMEKHQMIGQEDEGTHAEAYE